MSIAQGRRIADLQREVEAIKFELLELARAVTDLKQQAERPRLGRPPKAPQ
jgi:hypothetical protein